MGGIDPVVITHRLNVSPSFKPVKQKKGASPQKGRRRLMKRSASFSKQMQSGRLNILSGWPTLFSSKKKMTNGDFASISKKSTGPAQKIASIYLGLTS